MLVNSLILLINLIISVNNGICEYVGTVESLRKNIEELTEGTLSFSDQNLPYDENELSDTTPKSQSEYDFIVIGAGSAGSVIASRLSEISNVTILLIEAGDKEYSIMDIPKLVGYFQLSNQINWMYETESSEKYCLGMQNHKSKWPRGKVTGGSSVLNYMIAVRGNKIDYDEWANETIDYSWPYNSMLQYLKKLESFQVNDVAVDSSYHNKNGPVYITSSPYETELSVAFVGAAKELGYSSIDYNGAKQAGLTYTQSTIYKGERWSTNRAYLRPAKNRKNLFLTRNSFVEKILIDTGNKSAYGMRFNKSNKVIEVKARKEVILSAGAINSPQILMLSGVGPETHLRDLKINVIKNTPVGKNLIDHVAYGGLIFKVNDSSTYSNLSLVDPTNPTIEEYLTSRNGSLAQGSGTDALGFVNTDEPGSMNNFPNIEIHYGSYSGIKDPILSEVFGISDNYRNIMNRDQFNRSSWTVWPMLTKPRSRGEILLKRSNPYDKPKIYPNYLDDPEDVRVSIEGRRMALKLSKTDAFQKYGLEQYQVPLPCANYENDSGAYWECALRTYTMTLYHPVGTCKMGPENSTSSVVDPQLNVIGIKGLRVCDASIMPTVPSGNINIPVIAVAEKLSDQIKKRYGYIS